MKALILIVCFSIVSAAMATEVETDCPAMNESREKIIKTEKPRSVQTKGKATAQ